MGIFLLSRGIQNDSDGDEIQQYNLYSIIPVVVEGEKKYIIEKRKEKIKLQFPN